MSVRIAIIICVICLMIAPVPAVRAQSIWVTPDSATNGAYFYDPEDTVDDNTATCDMGRRSTQALSILILEFNDAVQSSQVRLYSSNSYTRLTKIETYNGSSWSTAWSGTLDLNSGAWTNTSSYSLRTTTRIRLSFVANALFQRPFVCEADVRIAMPTSTPTDTPAATSTPISTPTSTPTDTPTPTNTPTNTPTAPPYEESCATIAAAVGQMTAAVTVTPTLTMTPTPTPDCADYTAFIDNVLTSGDIVATIQNNTFAPVIAEQVRFLWDYAEAVAVIEEFALGVDCMQLAGHGTIWGTCDSASEDNYSWTESTGDYTISAMTAHQFIAAMVFDIDGSAFTAKFAPADFGLQVRLDNGCVVEATPAPRSVPTCLPGGNCGNNLCCMHARDAAFLAACMQVFEEGKCYELMQRLGPPSW